VYFPAVANYQDAKREKSENVMKTQMKEINMLVLIKLQTFLRDIRGATAVEYVLIIAGIAVAIVGALAAFGDDITAFIEGLSAELGIN
jgi:pilus assembly protein Flp/PilA